MSSQKKPTNEKRSSKFLTLLGLCAIITSTATTTLEQLSLTRDFAPVTKKSSLSEEEANDQPAQNNDSALEEIDLEKEWESILGDESELDFLAYVSRSF